MEEDHNTIYFPASSLQSSTDKKEEMVVKAGEDTGVYKALQAGKKKKATVVWFSFPTRETFLMGKKTQYQEERWNGKLNYLNDCTGEKSWEGCEAGGSMIWISHQRNRLVSQESTTQPTAHKTLWLQLGLEREGQEKYLDPSSSLAKQINVSPSKKEVSK